MRSAIRSLIVTSSINDPAQIYENAKTTQQTSRTCAAKQHQPKHDNSGFTLLTIFCWILIMAQVIGTWSLWAKEIWNFRNCLFPDERPQSRRRLFKLYVVISAICSRNKWFKYLSLFPRLKGASKVGKFQSARKFMPKLFFFSFASSKTLTKS